MKIETFLYIYQILHKLISFNVKKNVGHLNSLSAIFIKDCPGNVIQQIYNGKYMHFIQSLNKTNLVWAKKNTAFDYIVPKHTAVFFIQNLDKMA